MRICVYGAGAIGGWLGVKLALAGHAVSFVARGATLANIQAHGMLLTEDGQTHRAQVMVSDSTADLGEQDLVIICVKSPSVLDVVHQLKPLLGPDTVVMTAMNGVPWWFLQGFGGAFEGTCLQAVDPGGEIAKAIPAERILGCVVHASCSQSKPGEVHHHFGNRLIVGEPSGQKTARVQAIAELLTVAGFEVQLSEQIQKDTWYKLWGNMTVNPVSALTGATTDLILADPLVRDFISSVMLEAREIGNRIGIPILTQPEDRHAVTLKLGAFKTSMLQDVEAGRAVELDALVTVVKELGELTGVPTPQTDILLGLARLQARVRKLY
jgi:2-dehydropantoate 2-reductase